MSVSNLDKKILHIVQNFSVNHQSDIQNYLKQEGENIPQATLSRYLKKLNIAKVGGKYQIINHNTLYVPTITNIKISDLGLIVLHTNPGDANSLASFLDKKYISFQQQEENHTPILGTMAGDDTVLLIIKNKEDIGEVIALLQEDFPYLPGINIK